MVLKSDIECFQYLYQNNELLEYLRFNPRWYKILYYDPSMFDSFLNEAKTRLKIRTTDKLENIKNKVSFLSSLSGYLAGEK